MSTKIVPAGPVSIKPGSRPHRSPPRNDEGEITCLHDECKNDRPTFKRLCEFNKHMDKHERPYKCSNPACKKNPGFTYAGGLLRHQREVHSMHRTKEPFYCHHTSCNRSTGTGFSRRENLEEHLRRRHSGISGNADETTTESTTTSPLSAPIQMTTTYAQPLLQPLESLPLSRKRRVDSEAESNDEYATDLDSPERLRIRNQILQQENERVRAELAYRDQLLTEMLRENERLRLLLASPLPPRLPSLSQAQAQMEFRHQHQHRSQPPTSGIT